MTPNLFWSVGLAAIGITGLILAGRYNLWGWFVGFVAQFLWIAFGILSGQYGFILSGIAYGAVYARNFWLWREREKKRKNL